MGFLILVGIVLGVGNWLSFWGPVFLVFMGVAIFSGIVLQIVYGDEK